MAETTEVEVDFEALGYMGDIFTIYAPLHDYTVWGYPWAPGELRIETLDSNPYGSPNAEQGIDNTYTHTKNWPVCTMSKDMNGRQYLIYSASDRLTLYLRYSDDDWVTDTQVVLVGTGGILSTDANIKAPELQGIIMTCDDNGSEELHVFWTNKDGGTKHQVYHAYCTDLTNIGTAATGWHDFGSSVYVENITHTPAYNARFEWVTVDPDDGLTLYAVSKQVDSGSNNNATIHCMNGVSKTFTSRDLGQPAGNNVRGLQVETTNPYRVIGGSKKWLYLTCQDQSGLDAYFTMCDLDTYADPAHAGAAWVQTDESTTGWTTIQTNVNDDQRIHAFSLKDEAAAFDPVVFVFVDANDDVFSLLRSGADKSIGSATKRFTGARGTAAVNGVIDDGGCIHLIIMDESASNSEMYQVIRDQGGSWNSSVQLTNDVQQYGTIIGMPSNYSMGTQVDFVFFNESASSIRYFGYYLKNHGQVLTGTPVGAYFGLQEAEAASRTWSDFRMDVDFDSDGVDKIEAELRTTGGAVITGFDKASAVDITGDQTDVLITWSGKDFKECPDSESTIRAYVILQSNNGAARNIHVTRLEITSKLRPVMGNPPDPTPTTGAPPLACTVAAIVGGGTHYTDTDSMVKPVANIEFDWDDSDIDTGAGPHGHTYSGAGIYSPEWTVPYYGGDLTHATDQVVVEVESAVLVHPDQAELRFDTMSLGGKLDQDPYYTVPIEMTLDDDFNKVPQCEIVLRARDPENIVNALRISDPCRVWMATLGEDTTRTYQFFSGEIVTYEVDGNDITVLVSPNLWRLNDRYTSKDVSGLSVKQAIVELIYESGISDNNTEHIHKCVGYDITTEDRKIGNLVFDDVSVLDAINQICFMYGLQWYVRHVDTSSPWRQRIILRDIPLYPTDRDAHITLTPSDTGEIDKMKVSGEDVFSEAYDGETTITNDFTENNIWKRTLKIDDENMKRLHAIGWDDANVSTTTEDRHSMLKTMIDLHGRVYAEVPDDIAYPNLLTCVPMDVLELSGYKLSKLNDTYFIYSVKTKYIRGRVYTFLSVGHGGAKLVSL